MKIWVMTFMDLYLDDCSHGLIPKILERNISPTYLTMPEVPLRGNDSFSSIIRGMWQSKNKILIDIRFLYGFIGDQVVLTYGIDPQQDKRKLLTEASLLLPYWRIEGA